MIVVRACDERDLDRLLVTASPRDRLHYEERWASQQAGEATLLVAWADEVSCGRVTLLHASKYDGVSDLLGRFPEMNALEARPTGQGIGSAIIEAAEVTARALGATRIGLAVEDANDGARRLYERLGYEEWAHGLVVDVWTERDHAGDIVREHADPCSYLVKHLG